jgi:hypothetical protein
MKKFILPTALCLSFLTVAPAAAQDIAGKAREAEVLLSRGRVIEAIDALDEAAVALWERAPLSFRRGLWVVDKAAGYGIFNPRASSVFDSGETMLVYAEPVGFGWRRDGEIFQTDIAADVVFRTADGKEIYRKDEFQNLALAGRVRNREFMINFNYTLTGVPKGEYVVETTLRDRVSGKKGNFILPFTIR